MILDFIEHEHVQERADEIDFPISEFLSPQENDYFTLPEVISRYKYISALASIVAPERVVEFGTRRGYLAVALALGAPEPIEHYLGVDINRPNGWGGVAGGLAYAHSVLSDYCKDKLYGFQLVEANTFISQHWLQPSVQSAYYDLVVINADSSYPCVLRDLHSAWQMLNAGGLIFVLDSELQSVSEAIESFKGKTKALSLALPCHRGLTIICQSRELQLQREDIKEDEPVYEQRTEHRDRDAACHEKDIRDIIAEEARQLKETSSYDEADGYGLLRDPDVEGSPAFFEERHEDVQSSEEGLHQDDPEEQEDPETT